MNQIIELIESQNAEDVLLGIRIAEETLSNKELLELFTNTSVEGRDRLAEYKFKNEKNNWETLDIYSKFNYWINHTKIEIYSSNKERSLDHKYIKYE